MYLTKTPKFIQSLFPGFTWRMNTEEPVIYLTFDDGPIPSVTPWVLEQLKQYDAKATFFCVGENVQKHPEIFQQIVENEHAVGNHTYNHLSGWQTENVSYYHNIRQCAKLVKSDLFRPPYGRIKPKQSQFLSRHYNIIMWDILSGDFDELLSKEDCYEKVVKSARPGSIIVFHDSDKAWNKLEYVLPKVLDYFHKEGFRFEAIQKEEIKKKKYTPALFRS